MIIMSASSSSSDHSFQSLRLELESAVALLKSTTDPDARKVLLKQLRLLIEEADRLIASEARLRG
jgi:hypothetical protein